MVFCFLLPFSLESTKLGTTIITAKKPLPPSLMILTLPNPIVSHSSDLLYFIRLWLKIPYTYPDNSQIHIFCQDSPINYRPMFSRAPASQPRYLIGASHAFIPACPDTPLKLLPHCLPLQLMTSAFFQSIRLIIVLSLLTRLPPNPRASLITSAAVSKSNMYSEFSHSSTPSLLPTWAMPSISFIWVL